MKKVLLRHCIWYGKVGNIALGCRLRIEEPPAWVVTCWRPFERSRTEGWSRLATSSTHSTFTIINRSQRTSFAGVTILLSLTVFLNMVAETMPATSDAVPLLGKLVLTDLIIWLIFQCEKAAEWLIISIANHSNIKRERNKERKFVLIFIRQCSPIVIIFDKQIQLFDLKLKQCYIFLIVLILI